MSSVIFSDEEARFLRLMLRMVERTPDDTRASWMLNGFLMPERKTRPVGELRVLIVGGQGFCTGIFPDPSTLPASSYLHGCRHAIALEDARYTVDALELPADHLASPEHLTQALAITDCAVLVYDVADSASLTFLKALSNTIRDALHGDANGNMSFPAPTPSPTTRKMRKAFSFRHSTLSARGDPAAATEVGPVATTRRRRNYHFLLLGAKNDAHPSLREVSWLEGQTAAGEFFGPAGVVAGTSANFLEASAKSDEDVGAVFRALGREVLRSRRERKAGVLLLQRQQQQQQLLRPGGLEGGAFGGPGWGSSDFSVDDQGSTDESMCADKGSALAGSVRRGWCTLKATLSVGVFHKKA